MMQFVRDISFSDAWVFALLAVPLMLATYYFFSGRKLYATLKISDLKGVQGVSTPFRTFVKKMLPLLRIGALTALIFALARPQSEYDEQEVTSKGIDITMAIDVSPSMLAKDFKPNRLTSAKKVAAEFVEKRASDRIGLVVFGGESFTQCPITTDHKVVLAQIKEVRDGLLEDGTAIGEGLGTAVARLKESDAKSKVVILLTDGVNNVGDTDPLTAAEMALLYGVRVYTIGVGSNGLAMTPYSRLSNGRYQYAPMQVEIDEKTLKEVAKKTGGQYFRATNENALREIYDEIDQMEKTRIEVAAYTRKSERFHPFAFVAGFFFLLDIVLNYTIVRSLP